MRARYPDHDGFAERDGLKIGYEVYGRGERTVVLPPPDPIVHSRVWKGQIPYLSRYARVVAIDPIGNGRSDRTMDAARFREARREPSAHRAHRTRTYSCAEARKCLSGGALPSWFESHVRAPRRR